nr:DUF4315 family protein [Clostridia bacterium]
MDKATEKIVLEIEKEQKKKKDLEEKLKASNERIRLLEAKKLEAENAQIVASIRQLNVSPEELQSFLSSIKAKRGATVANVSDTKGVMEEKAV